MANGKIRFGKQSGGQLALVIPDGVTNTEVIVPESGVLVNKDYADLKVALADFTGTNANLTASGYQKMPSGLIIQWGKTALNVNTVIFPIAFPNQCFNVQVSFLDSASTATPYIGQSAPVDITINGFNYGVVIDRSRQWLSVGY